MTALLVESGVYFLLVFMPLAFGGVEGWALGVYQIVAGLVVAAWGIGRLTGRDLSDGGWNGGRALAIGAPIALFALLAAAQLVPLPPSLMRSVSPATWELYSRTLPGYAEGRPGDPARLPAWLLEQKRDAIPGQPVSGGEAGLLEVPRQDVVSPVRFPAWRPLSIHTHATREKLVLLFCHAGLFAVIMSYFRTRERRNRLLAVALFSGTAVSLVGLVQKFAWNGKLLWIREGTYLNVFGPFVNRNNYAAFAGMLLPVAICLALHGLRRMEKGEPGRWPQFLVTCFAAVSMLSGICVSLSRGGMIMAGASLLMIGVILTLYGIRRTEVGLLAGLVVASLFLLLWVGPSRVIERLETLSEGQDLPSLSLRAGAWEKSLDLIADHPVFGTGLGTYSVAFMRYAPPGEGWWTASDSDYINLVCDMGFLGTAFFLAALSVWAFHVAGSGLFARRGERYAGLGLATGLLTVAVHSAVASHMIIPAIGLFVSALGGVLWGMADGAREDRGRRRPSPGRGAP